MPTEADTNDDLAKRARDAERALSDFYPRVLELEALLTESRTLHDAARATSSARIAELEVELARALATIDELLDERSRLEREVLEEKAGRRFAEYHLELFQNTRAVRYLSMPRSVYASLRDFARPSR